MRIIDPNDVRMVAGEIGLAPVIGVLSNESTPTVGYRYVFEREDHTLSLVPLAAFAAHSCLSVGSCLVFIGTTKVWQSGHDDFLISAALTKMFGAEVLDFGDGSVILAESGDESALATHFYLGMIFGWDIDCCCNGELVSFSTSHDGFLDFFLLEDRPEFCEAFFNATRRRLVS